VGLAAADEFKRKSRTSSSEPCLHWGEAVILEALFKRSRRRRGSKDSRQDYQKVAASILVAGAG
tara:strand:+ start:116 stop:307 length:192 start_codon:yes stop_codon:yes gene_type:complete